MSLRGYAPGSDRSYSDIIHASDSSYASSSGNTPLPVGRRNSNYSIDTPSARTNICLDKLRKYIYSDTPSARSCSSTTVSTPITAVSGQYDLQRKFSPVQHNSKGLKLVQRLFRGCTRQILLQRAVLCTTVVCLLVVVFILAVFLSTGESSFWPSCSQRVSHHSGRLAINRWVILAVLLSTDESSFWPSCYRRVSCHSGPLAIDVWVVILALLLSTGEFLF